MTTTTATKVDPFQKEHILPLLASSMAYKVIHTKPRSNALIFVEIASSLVFPFSPPICCTSAFVIFPRLFEHEREKEEMKLFGISRECEKIVHEFETGKHFV